MTNDKGQLVNCPAIGTKKLVICPYSLVTCLITKDKGQRTKD
ncbi:hypothetical protein [[Phormidium] sp. ETS-05]|nr:hypothetical protein [[Phormidium] sp. ETS-05]